MSHPVPASYSAAQKWLHWLVAAIVLLLMAPVGLTMTRLDPTNPLTGTLYELHKSFGLIVLSLVVIRLAVRGFSGAPPLDPDIPAWRRKVALVSHYALYALLLLTPLAGWIATSSCCPPVKLFWTVPLTLPVSGDEVVSKTVFPFHYGFAFVLVGLALLHAAAALEHHFIRRDRTLLRMWPGGERESP